MMRVFDVDEWTENIKEAYKPFINAVRNMLLAPFYIGLVAIIIFVVVEMFLMFVEVVLIKANFVRQNIYAKVPVCIANEKQRENIKRAAKARENSISSQNKKSGTFTFTVPDMSPDSKASAARILH